MTERVGKQWFVVPDMPGQDRLSRRRDPTCLGTVLSAVLHQLKASGMISFHSNFQWPPVALQMKNRLLSWVHRPPGSSSLMPTLFQYPSLALIPTPIPLGQVNFCALFSSVFNCLFLEEAHLDLQTRLNFTLFGPKVATSSSGNTYHSSNFMV